MLEIDGLTVEEMRALDAGSQIAALNDLCGESKRLSDVKRAAISRHKDAKLAALRAGKSPSSDPEVIESKAAIDMLACEISARKEQIKILQTLLRAVPA